MRYLSVCSGIEAATQAWHPLGWTPVAFSEIEPFPCAVLAHHYPAVPNWGDMTRFEEWPDADVDVLAGGTPCQSFSIAGLRQGLADPRGNLALTYLAIAAKYRPRWLVWENVPGVLSILSHDAPDPCPPGIDLDGDQGPENGEEVLVVDEYEADENHALWCFMAGAAQLGYHGGFRTFDAQYVRTRRFPQAVPQRRNRVFFVGYLGDWRRAAAVLFDRESLSGHHPPRRKTGERIAPTISARPTGGGGLGTDFDLDGGLVGAPVAAALDASFGRLHGASNQDANHGHSHLVAFGGNNTRGTGADLGHDAIRRRDRIRPHPGAGSVMNRGAEVTLDWGDGTYVFALKWGQLIELQEKCDAGPAYILSQLLEGTWRVEQIGNILRLGLIGGGMEPVAALKLVRTYVQERPPLENLSHAQAVLAAAVMGAPDEEPGKPEAGAVRPSRSRAGKSGSRKSSVRAPSSA